MVGPQLEDRTWDFDFQWNGEDFASLGQEINALVQSMMPELEMALADLRRSC
jgi:hypothetical protein